LATRDDGTNVWGDNPPPAPTSFAKNIDYEIVWFAGRPVAQIAPDPASPVRRYTFADHLGTPLLQVGPAPRNPDGSFNIAWRVEYEPFGNVYEVREGTRTLQPLRFPGQELGMTWEGPEENYNVFRWYDSGWGRYNQADWLDKRSPYSYAFSNPVVLFDPLGLFTYTNDVNWLHDSVTGGAQTVLPGTIQPTHKCKRLPCNRFYLSFDLHVTTTIHLPTGFPPCIFISELNHVSIFNGAMNMWMNAVVPFERSYSSEADCKQAANSGYAALKDKAGSVQFVHHLAQMLEEIRHNFYNPCPFAGTP
jgi:RHS repeat-associated protein